MSYQNSYLCSLQVYITLKKFYRKEVNRIHMSLAYLIFYALFLSCEVPKANMRYYLVLNKTTKINKIEMDRTLGALYFAELQNKIRKIKPATARTL